MTFEDELKFIQILKKKPLLKIIFRYFRSENEMELNSLKPILESPHEASLALINEGVIRRWLSYSKDISCTIDTQNSEIIEFSRCKVINNHWFTDGRLWYQSDWWENAQSNGKKSEVFIKWADSVLRWIKTH